MAFPGIFDQFVEPSAKLARVVNLSTAGFGEWSFDRRVSVSVRTAICSAADAVTVHASLGTPGEAEMLRELVRAVGEAHDYGIPVIAAIYHRGASNLADGSQSLEQRTAHAARIALELGADVVKASYTGDSSSFATVVRACSPLPVLVAGGPYTSDSDVVAIARGSFEAGAAGYCFGRGLTHAVDLATVLRGIESVHA